MSRHGQEEKINKEKNNKDNEENNRQARMDIIGCARTKIVGEEQGRRYPYCKSVEAHRWRNRRQGASARGVVGYKGMNDSLPTK
jgi:type II secretory pathway component PulJ